MNRVVIMGRLVRDPEIRQAGETTVTRYTLAVDRRFKREGQPTADFIPCVVFGKSAEFAEKYFTKGLRVCVEGRIQTGSYEKEDGTRVYTTDIIVDNQEFADSKQSDGDTEKPQQKWSADVSDGTDEELPFE